jgi:RimJ/RimL family protein N-acetyltransferase
MTKGNSIKSFTSTKGNLVTFRYLRHSDISAALTFINTLIAEDTYIGMYGKPITLTEEKRFIDQTLKAIIKGEQSYVIVEINGQFIGAGEVRKEYLRRKKHVGNIAISLLALYREEGIGTELMKTLIDEAKRMNLRLLELTCFENNSRAQHVYRKIGFKPIGIIPGAIFFKNSYVGEVVMYLPL